MDLLRDAIGFAQTLPVVLKLAVIAAVMILAFLVCYTIWQNPPPKVEVATTQATITAAPDAKVQMASGEGSSITSSEEDRRIEHPQAPSNTGNVKVEGPNFGIVAGTYAPVTKEEKLQAIQRLKMQLSEFSDYPERVNANPSTQMEEMFINKNVQTLYNILSPYDKQTIDSIPMVGDDLNNIKKSYYAFAYGQKGIEFNLTKEISLNVEGRLPAAWDIYQRYMLMRFSGSSLDDIKSSGLWLNYGITWEDCERVYQLLKDRDIGKAAIGNIKLYADLLIKTHSLTQTIKDQNW